MPGKPQISRARLSRSRRLFSCSPYCDTHGLSHKHNKNTHVLRFSDVRTLTTDRPTDTTIIIIFTRGTRQHVAGAVSMMFAVARSDGVCHNGRTDHRRLAIGPEARFRVAAGARVTAIASALAREAARGAKRKMLLEKLRGGDGGGCDVGSVWRRSDREREGPCNQWDMVNGGKL